MVIVPLAARAHRSRLLSCSGTRPWRDAQANAASGAGIAALQRDGVLERSSRPIPERRRRCNSAQASRATRQPQCSDASTPTAVAAFNGPGSGGAPLTPHLRDLWQEHVMRRELLVADGGSPPRHDVNEAEGHVEPRLVIPDGGLRPPDGKQLLFVGVLAPQLHWLSCTWPLSPSSPPCSPYGSRLAPAASTPADDVARQLASTFPGAST